MTPRTLRLKLDYNLDPSDSEVTIEAVKSNALNIEFGIFQDSIPYDLSGLTSVTMVIRPARGTATNLAAITLPVASLTALPNSVRWNRGTMQHGIFEWTTAQMNQTVTGDYDDYWWSCYALLTTNEEVTLGNGIFRIYESNIANGGVPPVNPGATITADEADARYVRFDAATSLTAGEQTQARENIDADNAANLTSGIIPDARMPNLTGDITTSEGAVATTIGAGKVTNAMLAGSIDLATKVTGILPDSSMPNLTGDITTVEGAVATTLATVNGNVGSFGSATQVSAITVNAKGLVTAASAITVTPAESSLTFTDITTNNATSLKHGFLPKLSGSASDVLKGDGTWAAASAGSGSVTSVAMSVPSILTVSGSPITTSGTLAVTLATQAANLVFAGPATGVDATPTFRSLVAADIPSLSSTYLTVANPTASGEFNLSDSGTFNNWQFTPGSRYFSFIEGGGGFGMQFNIPILTADRSIFWPDSAGTVALSASGNIALSAAGNITFTGTLPVANGGTGITAIGTGVATALGVNVGTAGAFVVNGGALGTPSSGTLTSCTGLPAAGVVGTAAILGANTFTALQTITQASANAGILASTGYSLTGSNATNMVDLAGTWNTSGTPTAIKLNITDTNSNASSILFDLQIGGVSRGKLLKDGTLILNNGGYTPASLYMKGTSGSGTLEIGRLDQNAIAGISSYAQGGIVVGLDRYYCFSSTSSVVNGSNIDLFIARKAAATLQLGLDAAGVTNQSLTAASRITSDGVGANLTISAGNGRGGAGGSLIFSTYDTQGTGTIGNLQTRMTIDTAGLTTLSGSGAVKLRFTDTATSRSFYIQQQNYTSKFVNETSGGVMHFVDGSSNVYLKLESAYQAAFTQTGISFTNSYSALGTEDLFLTRKAAATLQLGQDANGVTNQSLTAASRITSDGVGANLTISAGNGRGGAGGSLIFSTYTTAGAATIGTLTTRITLDTDGLLAFANGVNLSFVSSKIGNSITDGLSFWGASPTTQPAHIADSSGDAGTGADTVDLTTLNASLSSIHTAIAAINAMLATTGLTAAS